MPEKIDIEGIARRAANAELGNGVIDSIIVEATTDSEGREALRITIVIKPGTAKKLTGDRTLDTLYRIQTDLSLAGEQRLAIVEYATRKELEESGASKS